MFKKQSAHITEPASTALSSEYLGAAEEFARQVDRVQRVRLVWGKFLETPPERRCVNFCRFGEGGILQYPASLPSEDMEPHIKSFMEACLTTATQRLEQTRRKLEEAALDLPQEKTL